MRTRRSRSNSAYVTRGDERVVIKYELPLGETIQDLYAVLKSRSKGYASMDYEVIGFNPATS